MKTVSERCLLCSAVSPAHSSNCPRRATATAALLEHIEENAAVLAEVRPRWLGRPMVDGVTAGPLTLCKWHDEWQVVLGKSEPGSFGPGKNIILTGSAEEIDQLTQAWLGELAPLLGQLNTDAGLDFSSYRETDDGFEIKTLRGELLKSSDGVRWKP